MSLIKSPHAKEGTIQYSASSWDLHKQGEEGGAVWREKGSPHGGPHSPESKVFAQALVTDLHRHLSFFLFEIFVWSVFGIVWHVFGIVWCVFGILWSVFGIVQCVFGTVWRVFGIVWSVFGIYTMPGHMTVFGIVWGVFSIV